MNLIKSLRSLLRIQILRRGITIAPFPLVQYLRDFKIDCVLDVGANVGQYASQIRSLGYRNRIESFEPMSKAFGKLQDLSRRDANWNIHNFALGNSNSSETLNISANGPSSSFLDLTDESKSTETIDLNYVSQESVQVRRLDDIFDELSLSSANTFLKIDTQGFEKQVLEGGTESLKHVRGVQLEVALTPTYEGEWLAAEVLQWFDAQGFVLYWMMHGYRDRRSNQLKEVDAIFFRKSSA